MAKVQSLVAIFLSRLLVVLVRQLLLRRHLIPNPALLLVQVHEVLPLSDEYDEAERQD
jgi:hypothetical protein